jgi:hypothetical protein
MNAGWISSTCPPRVLGRYLVTRKGELGQKNYNDIGIYYPQKKMWTDVNFDPIYDVIGWMSGPDPMRDDE